MQIHIPCSRILIPLGKHMARMLFVLVLGGLLGATLVRFAPGYGIHEEELDSRLSSESLIALRASQEQQKSVAAFYGEYLWKLMHGDLGSSETLHEPVRQLLTERMPETFKSVAVGLAFGWSFALLCALAIAISRTGFLDITTSFLVSILLCMPAAVLAILFVLAQVPGRYAIALIIFPKIFHYARNLLVRSALMPHVLTARAKGLGSIHILFFHILLTAAPQLLALAGVSVSIAFAAAIPIEVLCDLPGIGQLAWKAALGRDLVLLVNLTMIVMFITLIANAAAEWATPIRHSRAI